MREQDFEKAIQIVEQHHKECPQSAEWIEKAEKVLGGIFPQTYRAFLAKFGAGRFGSEEFYGMTRETFTDKSVPNGIWLTLLQRADSPFPTKYAIVGSTGDGAFYCVEFRSIGDSPVVIYEPGISPEHQQTPEKKASDFRAFFLKTVSGDLSGAATLPTTL